MGRGNLSNTPRDPKTGRLLPVPRPRKKKRYTRPYSQTGIHTVKRAIQLRGLAALDQRSHTARALLDWRRDLLTDLGGKEQVTAAQYALVEMAARTKLFIDHLDAWLLARPQLVIYRKRSAFPVLIQRQHLVDSLVRILSQLGLERKGPKALDLGEYLATRYEEKGPAEGGEPVEGQGPRQSG